MSCFLLDIMKKLKGFTALWLPEELDAIPLQILPPEEDYQMDMFIGAAGGDQPSLGAEIQEEEAVWQLITVTVYYKTYLVVVVIWLLLISR